MPRGHRSPGKGGLFPGTSLAPSLDRTPRCCTSLLASDELTSPRRSRFSTTPLAKHPPLGNPRYNGLSQPLTLCPAPPTTAAPTQPSSTTRTTTTQTLTTVTQTTATTQTSTSSTTQMPLPSLPPLAPPNFTADGRVDLGDSLVRHGREQGLMASYYSYAGMNHVVTIERDSYSAARQNW